MTKARIREIRETSAKNSAHAAIINELLETIERLQSYTRRGEEPTPEPEALPHAAKGKPEKDARVRQFFDLWLTEFKKFHGADYHLVNRGKDFAAIKRLLQAFPNDPKAVGALLDTAWEAWYRTGDAAVHPNDKFNSRQASTIAGFASRFNEIRVELKTTNAALRPAAQGPAKCTL